MQHGLDQVQALLVDKAGDHADDRRVLVALDAAELEQLELVDLFVLRRLGAVVLEDLGVGLRVERIHVDAVQDAVQLVAVHAQHGIQTVAVVFGLDLVCVGGGDRRHRSGGHDRGLHQVDVAIHRHEARAEVRVVDAEHILEDLAAVAALILDVVDGEHGLDVLIERTGGEHQVVVDRHERALPVVAVDDVGLPLQIGQHLEHGLGEVGEALCVVILAVDLAAGEVILVVDEVEGHAIRFIAENAAVLVAPAQTDISVLEVVEFLAPILPDRGIQRAEHAHVMPLCGERLGQRAGNVAQTTGLDERSTFAGDIHDFHNSLPSPVGGAETEVPLPHPHATIILNSSLLQYRDFSRTSWF